MVIRLATEGFQNEQKHLRCSFSFMGPPLRSVIALWTIVGYVFELTPTLQKSESFRDKASGGEVVVHYFEPSATQDLKFSGFPPG